MKFSTAFDFYGTNRAIATAAAVSEQAVSQWKRAGVVPLKSANRLELESKGKVKVDPQVYERTTARTPTIEPAGA